MPAEPQALTCRCKIGCAGAEPCKAAVTQEDWLCDQCRAAKAMEGDERYYHCHECGDQVDAKNELEASVLMGRIMAAAKGKPER